MRRNLLTERKKKLLAAGGELPFTSVPGMGDDLVVKVHYGLGSRNR